MLSVINELISIEMLIWSLPIIFLIHDGEEIVAVEKFLRANKERPELAKQARLINWDKNITIQFSFAVLLLGSVLMLITLFAIEDYDSKRELNMFFVGAVAVILLDGLKHVAVSIAMKAYTPGLLTAALVEVPYGAYTVYRLFDSSEIDAMKIILGTAILLPLTVGLVGLGLIIGRWISPYTSRNTQGTSTRHR